MKHVLSGIAIIGLLAFLCIQMIRPAIPHRPSPDEIRIPPNVKAVLEKDCYSCHSDARRLSWFDEVQPAYWLVRRDILKARARLDFSTIGSKPEPAQKAALFESVTMMQLGAMPLPRYLQLHPESKVTAEDLATIKDYLSPWSSPIPAVPTDMGAAASFPINPHSAEESLNGIPYDRSWHSWKLLGITDRGDNRQFRLVLGNNAAVKAARMGNVHPWPDGTRFAKVAWLQQQTPEGLVVPGGFWQIELMIKDAKRFRATDGWGWARWRGINLKPYGKDAAFVKECTGCHLPMQGNDDVYTLPISSATVQGKEVLDNAASRLPKGLPMNPLDWTPVTMYSDPQKHTISVLFINSKEIGTVAVAGDSSTMALVTWTERDDPHWFGARIADQVISVEILRPGAGKETEYRIFGGVGVAGVYANATKSPRAASIAGLHPVQIP
jgi:heme-binding protein/cytochrome P460